MIKRFIKNSSWILGGNILIKVLNFITLGFLARVLNPHSLGYYNAIQNSGNSINMMSSLGTPLIVQRLGARINELGVAKVSEMLSTAFTLYLLVNIACAVTLLIFPGYFFELLLDSKGSIGYINILSVIIMLNAVNQIPLYLLLGMEEFRKYSLINLVCSVVFLVVAFVLVVVMKDNLMAALYGLILAFGINILILAYLFASTLRKHQIRLKLSIKLSLVKKIFSEGFIYYFGNTFLVAVSSLVIISLFYKSLSSLEYGYLRIGNAFAIVFTIIPSAIQPVTISLLATQRSNNDYIKSLQLRLIPFLSSLLLITLIFNLELIIKISFGQSYAGATNIVLGLLLLQMLNIYLGLINSFQTGVGNLNYIGWVATVTCLYLMITSYFLIPKLGITGYFVSLYTATFLSLILMALKEFTKYGPISREDRNSLLLVFTLTGIAFFGGYYLSSDFRILLTILLILGVLMLFWKTCLRVDEKDLLWEEIQSKRKLLSAGSKKF